MYLHVCNQFINCYWCAATIILEGQKITEMAKALHISAPVHAFSILTGKHNSWLWMVKIKLAECLSIPNHSWYSYHNNNYYSWPSSFGPKTSFMSIKVEEVCSEITCIQVFRTMVSPIHINCAGQIRMNPLTTTQWAMFWTGKIVHCLFKYVVPYFYVPFWHLVSNCMLTW